MINNCSLLYTLYTELGDEGQLVSNINPDYPNADIKIERDKFRGDPVKLIVIDTGRNRLNVQNSVLQFQPVAEVDISFKWPKQTRLRSSNNDLYWSFELSEPITEGKYKEFANDPNNRAWSDASMFDLSDAGTSIYTKLTPPINVRNSKIGFLRKRDFFYDTLLSSDTPSLPLREGRNSDVVTCVQPK